MLLKKAHTAAVLALAMLSGCTAPAGDFLFDAHSQDAERRPTVIALIDTGVNFYHRDFQAAEPDGDPGSFIASSVPQRVNASGSYAERKSTDAALLASLEQGRLYRFVGTRLASISFGVPDDAPLLLDYADHGTGTAYLALREDPSAFVVMVQTYPRLCGATEACVVDESVAAAIEWVADQAWIDVVSVSLNLRANVPLDEARQSPEMARYLEASKRIAASGRLLVNSAGNELVPSAGSSFAGPPWIIAVGGFEPATRGESLTSSRVVDVVSNNSERVPSAQHVEAQVWTSGTSFAAPIVAGTLSQTISLLRAKLGDGGRMDLARLMVEGNWGGERRSVDAGEIRESMNRSARQVGPLDWDPTASPRGDPIRDAIYMSLPIVAGPLQIGWGYVNGELATEMATAILEGSEVEQQEPSPTTRLHQSSMQAARESYWDAFAAHDGPG